VPRRRQRIASDGSIGMAELATRPLLRPTFWTRDAQLGDQIDQSERRFTSGLLASR
jgi:hypothetical protein